LPESEKTIGRADIYIELVRPDEERPEGEGVRAEIEAESSADPEDHSERQGTRKGLGARTEYRSAIIEGWSIHPFSDHINRANFGESWRSEGSEREAESQVTGPLRFRKSEFLEEDEDRGEAKGRKTSRCLASGEKEPKGSRTAAVFAL